jgi:hypothetical protein
MKLAAGNRQRADDFGFWISDCGFEKASGIGHRVRSQEPESRRKVIKIHWPETAGY